MQTFDVKKKATVKCLDHEIHNLQSILWLEKEELHIFDLSDM